MSYTSAALRNARHHSRIALKKCLMAVRLRGKTEEIMRAAKAEVSHFNATLVFIEMNC
jgi:hypothetical protein